MNDRVFLRKGMEGIHQRIPFNRKSSGESSIIKFSICSVFFSFMELLMKMCNSFNQACIKQFKFSFDQQVILIKMIKKTKFYHPLIFEIQTVWQGAGFISMLFYVGFGDHNKHYCQDSAKISEEAILNIRTVYSCSYSNRLREIYDQKLKYSQDAVFAKGTKLGLLQGKQSAKALHLVQKRILWLQTLSMTLNSLNLSIKQGKKIAFVGPSGCGKSTMMQLLQRFYDCTGLIMVDGVDIKNYDVHHLRSHFAIVSQEPSLFTGTLKENIKYNKDPRGAG